MKLKQYMTTKPPLQKILQGLLHTESERKQSHERAGSTKPRRRKDKKIETLIQLPHYQTLTQLRQLNDRNHHIPINTKTEY
jgi:flagellar biosynthesis/type III secretory pathway chaperone